MAEEGPKFFTKRTLEDFLIGAVVIGGLDVLFPTPYDATLSNTLSDPLFPAFLVSVFQKLGNRSTPEAVQSGIVLYGGGLVGQTLYQITSNYFF